MQQIQLYNNTESAFLIIEDENSPVAYHNQTNGYACSNSGIKGYLVPIEFCSDLKHKFCNDGYMGNGWALDKEFLADLPEILFQIERHLGNEYKFELNQKKVAENIEAWVHLTGKRINSEDSFGSILFGFPDEINAVLTWPNSD